MPVTVRRWWLAWAICAVVAVCAGGGIAWWKARSAVQPTVYGKPQVEIQVGESTPVQSVDGAQAASIARDWVAHPPAQDLDASAFVQAVYGSVGVTLPRTVLEQAGIGRRIYDSSQILPGDLVFFHEGDSSDPVTFVAIAVGDGQAAARTLHGYQLINYTSGYWAEHFRFAVRVGAR